jgi:RNA polymerase sigma factor (sigma-70 family)
LEKPLYSSERPAAFGGVFAGRPTRSGNAGPELLSAGRRDGDTRDPHLAQDIAQTVFLIFARKARRLAREVSLPGWFIRTAQFVSRDAMKKVARRSYYEAAGSAESRDATEAYEVTGAALLLTEAILALSPKEQVCVLARFHNERAMGEIARAHGISEDAAQKRIERGLDKMRSFFARRGFRVAAGIVPGLFVTAFPRGAEAQAVQTVLSGLHAANTAGATTASLLHANQLSQALSRRELLSIGLKSGAALLVASAGVGGYVAVHEPAVPALPPFRPSGPQIEALARAWADVVRQVAAIMANPQARQQTANAASMTIVNETVRISTELEALRTPEKERTLMAEFLTIELRETLRLSERQQGLCFQPVSGTDGKWRLAYRRDENHSRSKGDSCEQNSRAPLIPSETAIRLHLRQGRPRFPKFSRRSNGRQMSVRQAMHICLDKMQLAAFLFSDLANPLAILPNGFQRSEIA